MYFKIFIICSVLLVCGVIVVPTQITFADEFEWNSLLSWGDVDKINVVINSDFDTDVQKVDIVKSVIESKSREENYFYGWNDAISYISEKEVKQIPLFNIVNNTQEPDVIIFLTEKKHHHMMSGFTKYIFSNQTIQKAHVTLYDFDELNEQEVEILTRHELGHVIGLGHTTNPFDLMSPILSLHYDLISMFDLITLSKIYP